MKLRSMEEKISYRLFLMGFLGLVFTAVLCIFVFHKAFTAQAWSGLERETDLVRAGYEQTRDPAQLSAFVTDDLRVTLISQDGSVLFESATDQPMENHLTRPEIRDAIANGEGRDIRDSQTMGYETYYYALRLSGGDVLRVAQDAETVWSIYDATIPELCGADAGRCGAGSPADQSSGTASAEHDRGSGSHSGKRALSGADSLCGKHPF